MGFGWFGSGDFAPLLDPQATDGATQRALNARISALRPELMALALRSARDGANPYAEARALVQLARTSEDRECWRLARELTARVEDPLATVRLIELAASAGLSDDELDEQLGAAIAAIDDPFERSLARLRLCRRLDGEEEMNVLAEAIADATAIAETGERARALDLLRDSARLGGPSPASLVGGGRSVALERAARSRPRAARTDALGPRAAGEGRSRRRHA